MAEDNEGGGGNNSPTDEPEGGGGNNSPTDEPSKKGKEPSKKGKTKKVWKYFKEKSYNSPAVAFPKLAIATVGFIASSFFLKGTIFLWIAWFVFGLMFLGAVLWLFPIPLEWKVGIAKVFRFFLILGIVITGFIFLRAGYQTGGWKELLIGVEETGAESATKTTWNKVWGTIMHPGRIYDSYSDWSGVDVAEENVKKGIEFFDLRTRRPWFEEEGEIILYGSARITALPDVDTKVVFDCNLNDTDIEDKNYDPKGKLTLRNMEGNSLNVYAGRDEVVSFECKLNGIPLNLSDKARADKEEDSRTFTAMVEGIYHDFTTTTVLSVYNIKKDEYDLLIDPEDLIPNKNLNGKVSSECINGCGLTTVPLTTDQLIQTEIGSNLLGIALKKDSDWYGEIDSVSKIDVRMPDNFQLIACDHFGGDSILDDGDAYLDVLNQDLKNNKYGGARDFSFYCDYKIVRPRAFLGPSEVSVDTTYNYKVEAKKAIKIIEKKVINIGSGDNGEDLRNGSGSSGDNGEGDTRYYYA